jgi:hypothetical protein
MKDDHSQRDYEIALAVLSGQSMTQVAAEYNISKNRVLQIFKAKLRQAESKARVTRSLPEERRIYNNNIRSRNEWSTSECIKNAEVLKRLLDAANKT